MWRYLNLNVDGDVDRFSCEYLHEIYRKASDQRVAQRKNIGDQMFADGDRFEVSQAYVAMVSLDDRDLRDLGRLSRMTSWSYDILMAHKKEVRQCKFNELDESRLDRLNQWGLRDVQVPRAPQRS